MYWTENAHLLVRVDACGCMYMYMYTRVCVGQRMPIGVNVCVCMYVYMYASDRKCRLCACTCRYMGRQSYVDACVVHVHVWDREYPFVDENVACL